MSDDFDPEVADALRRFAGSAPQPHEDRLQSVVAGVRRRQVRVISASAVSVVALVTATAFGVHSWRNTADSGPVG
ncbi:MAG: hypothetical protein QOJ62_3033, partial [Actinomycetota bacterium]|nr:hypothetical protein [Actinomycetota bacterium]